MKKTKLTFLPFVLVAAVAVGTFAAYEYTRAGASAGKNPSMMEVTFHKVTLHLDSDDAEGVEIAIPEGEGTVDIIGSDLDDVFGGGKVPAGAYHQVKFTLGNQIRYRGEDPCGGIDEVEGSYLIDAGKSDDDLIELTASTDWTGQLTMNRPIVISEGVVKRLELRFDTSGSIICADGEPTLRKPDFRIIEHEVSGVEPLACNIHDDGGEYWFVHYNLYSDLYDDNGDLLTGLTPHERMSRSGISMGWGTVAFNNDLTWHIYPGKTHDQGGMAEHRHGLLHVGGDDSGYNDPAEFGAEDQAMSGTYALSGSMLTMYHPGSEAIQAGLSADCNVLVGVDTSRQESDLIYAVRKPSAAPPALEGLMVGSGPGFELKYESEMIERIHFRPNLAILDFGDNNTVAAEVSLDNSVDFQADYSGDTLTGWTVGDPVERAEMNGEMLEVEFQIREDGLVNNVGINTFVAVGAGGSAVVASRLADMNDWDNHQIEAGFFIPVKENPAPADLAGTWTLAMFEQEAWPTDQGDEVRFGLSFGSVTVAADGSFSYHLNHKNIFDGLFGSESGTGALLRTDECYYVDEGGNGADLDADPCPEGGLLLPVFRVQVGEEPEQERSRIVLDKTGKVFAIWEQLDLDGTPQDCDVAGPDENRCNPNPRFMTGLGVKMN